MDALNSMFKVFKLSLDKLLIYNTMISSASIDTLVKIISRTQINTVSLQPFILQVSWLFFLVEHIQKKYGNAFNLFYTKEILRSSSVCIISEHSLNCFLYY